jgi:nanoRNase/pAp phosphatase (c-di-AMP/oligoRNAs hydrolase)
MLVVVVLLPLSLPMYDGEFDHGGGGGSPAAAAVAAAAVVEAVEDNLSAKAVGN